MKRDSGVKAIGRFPAARRTAMLLITAVLTAAGITYADISAYVKMGKQPDGSFIVSTEQRVEAGAIAFGGRPIDLALHPSGAFAAVLNQQTVLLVSAEGVIRRSSTWLGNSAGFRGLIWSSDGKRLFASVAGGYVQEFKFQNQRLQPGSRIQATPPGVLRNPRPGGMAITRDSTRLFVAVSDRNAVAEIDLPNNRWLREYRVQNLPFAVELSGDEKKLIVTNWGGRTADDDDDKSMSGGAAIVVDPRGAAATGSVCVIRRGTGETRTLQVGLHPTGIAVQGDRAFVANSASDSLTEINLTSRKVTRTLPLHWGSMKLFGSMPCALAIRGSRAYICNGGDNAVCVMDLITGKVLGFFPAGYYPVGIAVSKQGNRAFVLNTKGNGSVQLTNRGSPGTPHQFQGTVSVIDLAANLTMATARVASNNGWLRSRAALHPNRAVYHGAIQHVLYIIKENRSYDEVFGDIPEGNGDKRLCFLGENLTPNHHALARQFTLFDNAYVSGTNSADGHQWCTQALANDYLERFYTGYRTFSFDGSCPMSISSAGCLWDAALKRGRTIRDYGEFCDTKLAVITPKGKTWKDLWADRASGKNQIQTRCGTRIASLRPYTHPNVLCWPLVQSDQERADYFIADYNRLSRADKVPNLMFLTLPCDHTEGSNPNYPKPESMVADNDLALGRVVEAVSRSAQWKNTCIFVIEDDAQFGRDHVDGHRTVYFALSPYTRRGFVSHEMCNTVSMIRSIELMLGISPMNRFDALTPPIADCFTDTRDLTPYKAVPNRLPLDLMNTPLNALRGQELRWTQQSMSLDWSGPDRADPKVLNKVIWHSICGVNTPYPDP